jgi:ubiquinone/menaquinone biosynthesis C-methylase UbiE
MTRWNTRSYDAWYATPFGAYSHKLESELVHKLLGDVGGRRVLDAGSGTGIYTLELAHRGARVVALDVSREMIRVGKRKLGKRTHHVLGSIEQLPFKEQAFDCVVSVLALCFTADPGRAVAEMNRVSKGKVVVAVFNSWSPFAAVKRIKSMLTASSFRGARFFSPLMLKSLGAVRWDSTLFALPFFPAWLLSILRRYDKKLSRVLKPFGAFIVLEIE